MIEIIIRDENIKKVLKSSCEWYIPGGKFEKDYRDNINDILEAFYYKNITNTWMPDYFGFGSHTSFRIILKSFFTEDYYSKAWQLRGHHMMDTMLRDKSFNLLIENLVRDEDGKSIMHVKSAKNSVINGNCGFINRSKESYLRQFNTNLRRYGCRVPSISYWKRTEYNQNVDDLDNYVSDGRIYEHNKKLLEVNLTKFCSNPLSELNTCKILSDLSLDYDRQVIIKTNNHTYWIDFYIKDLDIYLEIDGPQHFNEVDGELIYTESDKIREFYIESKLHKSIIRIPSWDIWYYLSHKREFLSEITKIKYPIIKI